MLDSIRGVLPFIQVNVSYILSEVKQSVGRKISLAAHLTISQLAALSAHPNTYTNNLLTYTSPSTLMFYLRNGTGQKCILCGSGWKT